MKSANAVYSILERQCCIGLRALDSVATPLGDKSCLCSPLTMWLGPSYPASLCPSFLIWKLGSWEYLSYRVLGSKCKAFRLSAIAIIRDVIQFQKSYTFHFEGSNLVSYPFQLFLRSYYRMNLVLPKKVGWEVCKDTCVTCNSQFEADGRFSLAVVNSRVPKINTTWKDFEWNSV